MKDYNSLDPLSYADFKRQVQFRTLAKKYALSGAQSHPPRTSGAKRGIGILITYPEYFGDAVLGISPPDSPPEEGFRVLVTKWPSAPYEDPVIESLIGEDLFSLGKMSATVIEPGRFEIWFEIPEE